jgi:ribonuclease HII
MLKLGYQSKLIEAGVDEAGRGCLAGPVFAAAVILPKGFRNKLLNDSKQLTHEEREHLRRIIEKKAVAYAVAQVDVREIETINILRSSIKAMHCALDGLHTRPQLIIVDGNRFYPYQDIKAHTVIDGDATYMNIAAASVLAKTYRDDYMVKLHEEFPQYNWSSNKGYGTPEHVNAIRESGYCIHHRKTFVVKSLQQLELFDEPSEGLTASSGL